MANNSFTENELDTLATRIAKHITAQGSYAEENPSEALINAIVSIYGSLDAFYQMVWQYLSPLDASKFAQLVQKKATRKTHHVFTSIITSEIFSEIVKTLKLSKATRAEEATHASSSYSAPPQSSKKGKPKHER